MEQIVAMQFHQILLMIIVQISQGSQQWAESNDQFVEDGELGRMSAAQMFGMEFVLEYRKHLLEHVLFHSKQFLIFPFVEPGNSFLVIHRQENSTLTPLLSHFHLKSSN